MCEHKQTGAVSAGVVLGASVSTRARVAQHAWRLWLVTLGTDALVTHTVKWRTKEDEVAEGHPEHRALANASSSVENATAVAAVGQVEAVVETADVLEDII